VRPDAVRACPYRLSHLTTGLRISNGGMARSTALHTDRVCTTRQKASNAVALECDSGWYVPLLAAGCLLPLLTACLPLLAACCLLPLLAACCHCLLPAATAGCLLRLLAACCDCWLPAATASCWPLAASEASRYSDLLFLRVEAQSTPRRC